MIFVLGGTEDGRELACYLEQAFGINSTLLSLTTAYGAQLARESFKGEILAQPLAKEGLIHALQQHQSKVLVDGTHPFAREMKEIALEVSSLLSIPYLRYERPLCSLPHSKKVFYAKDYHEGAKISFREGERVLLTIGSRRLRYFLPLIKEKKVFARVLPRIESIGHCLSLGLSPSEIIGLQGPFTYAFNKELIVEYCIDLLVTKESGALGGEEEKVNAALDVGASVVVIQRPSFAYPFLSHTFHEVKEEIQRIINTEQGNKEE